MRVMPNNGRWNYFGEVPGVAQDPLESLWVAPPADPIHKPSHYTALKPEPVDLINSWKLNFNKGNAIKYIARAGRKGDAVEDLKKAIRYLEIEIECLQKEGT
jgi:hypothetical protein